MQEHFKACFTRGNRPAHANHVSMSSLDGTFAAHINTRRLTRLDRGNKVKDDMTTKSVTIPDFRGTTRPFHGGALWGVKSLGKIQQMCDEERWRREPRQKGTL